MVNLRKKMLAPLLLILTAVTLFAPIADARSLGGGKSLGRQSNNYSQRQAPPPQSAPAPQRTAPAQTPPPQPAVAPQPQRNRWLGPLAGLATGLGIAALMSHFGMGGAFAESMSSLLLIAAVAMAGMFLWRRMRGSASPLQANGVNQTHSIFSAPASEPTPSLSAADTGWGAPLTAVPEFKPSWRIPADFDADGFLHTAKVLYVRLQAAWDTANLDDIREFTTPEMFAEIKLQLNERGAEINITDVTSVNAELLGIEDTPRDQLASVRFTGTLRPAPNSPIEPFDEVWNLTKLPASSSGWLLAGLQQAHG